MKWKYKIDHQVKAMDEIYSIAVELSNKNGPYRIAIAGGSDIVCLEGLNLGRERGLIEPILVGHQGNIIESLEKLGLNYHDWMIYSEKEAHNSAQKAARLVTSGMADILMRGKLLARDFFRALLDPKLELRDHDDFWTNIVVFEIEGIDRLIFLTDPAVVTHTDIPGRLRIIQNVTEFAAFLGVTAPKVSLLAAVESVTPGMPVSLEEAAIAKMSERGQFPKGVLVDGPLSLDLSVDPESVKKKGLDSPVAGYADILVVNNINIGNVLFKSLVTLCGAKSASTIVGPEFPIILTSRSESPENILYSIALAIMMVGRKD
ncbi:phosphate butyryltransferase [bacterium]|nr:phosphate butyryltransferase [bacterium]